MGGFFCFIQTLKWIFYLGYMLLWSCAPLATRSICPRDQYAHAQDSWNICRWSPRHPQERVPSVRKIVCLQQKALPQNGYHPGSGIARGGTPQPGSSIPPLSISPVCPAPPSPSGICDVTKSAQGYKCTKRKGFYPKYKPLLPWVIKVITSLPLGSISHSKSTHIRLGMCPFPVIPSPLRVPT